MQSPSKKFYALWTLVGVLIGGLAVGVNDRLKYIHHYQELETFFRGTVAGREVLGISYFEYDGIGFMQWNQWKVVLRDQSDSRVTIYQNHPIVQEPIPHQPNIKIEGSDVSIDDGENKLKVHVEPLPPEPADEPAASGQHSPAPKALTTQ